MPVFEYIALNQTGKQIKGTVDADSIRSARQKLRAQNVFPTDIKESAQAAKQKTQDVQRFLKRDKVSVRELTLATRLLATLSNAGIPLIGALVALADQVESTALKRIVVDIKEKVEQGSSLAKALGAYPKVFSRLYINMVASGEASGTLDQVLENLATYYEEQMELRRKIASAIFYPILMLGLCTLIVIALVTFVVPKIVEIFIKQKLALPVPTQIVIGVSHILTGYWYLLVLAVMAFMYLCQYYYRQPKGRSQVDYYLLRAPMIGILYRKVATARISSTLGTLLNGGVELLAAIEIVKNIVGNVHLQKALEDARDGVREGRSLAREFSKTGYFPNLLPQMVAIGEKSGRLESMLSKAGKAFTNDVNASIAGLTSILSPILVVVIGGVVLFIVIAVLLPMTQMMNMFKM